MLGQSNARTLAPLIAELRRDLLAQARRIGRDEAEDLVHSTIERALSRADSFTPGTNLRAWLGRIMQNLEIDWLRRARPGQRIDMDEEQLAQPAGETPPVWTGLHKSDVVRAMAVLSPEFRVVIELFHVHGVSYAEMARRLEVPIGTIGTRLQRARLQLRARLEQVLEGSGPPDIAPREPTWRPRSPAPRRASRSAGALGRSA